MHVALIIGGSLVIVGVILYVHHRLTSGRAHTPENTEDKTPPATAAKDEECCGMHITCERDSLSAVFADEIVYFDDEELDAYAGRPAISYTTDEIEVFRDVLLTLRPDDIAPWARSIQQRGITLPDVVRDELFLIVSEERQKRAKS